MPAANKAAVPMILVLVIGALFIWSAIEPYSRAVWYAEVLPIAVVFGLLVTTYRYFQFSNTAYLFMSAWLIMH